MSKKPPQSIRSEIRQNLLGSLEVALFMPVARLRFGRSQNAALRSFLVPVLLLPLTLLGVVMYPPSDDIAGKTTTIVMMLYALRFMFLLGIFYFAVYWICDQIERRDEFIPFVIAYNWLHIPAAVIYIPVAWMLINESKSWDELQAFMVCLTFYVYAFQAFMISYVMRMPYELAGFLIFISIALERAGNQMVYWLAQFI